MRVTTNCPASVAGHITHILQNFTAQKWYSHPVVESVATTLPPFPTGTTFFSAVKSKLGLKYKVGHLPSGLTTLLWQQESPYGTHAALIYFTMQGGGAGERGCKKGLTNSCPPALS